MNQMHDHSSSIYNWLSMAYSVSFMMEYTIRYEIIMFRLHDEYTECKIQQNILTKINSVTEFIIDINSL